MTASVTEKPDAADPNNQRSGASVDPNECYREVGTFYRHFLTWRHASVVGMIIVVFGSLQLTMATIDDHPRLASWIPILASPIGVLLWFIDLRTRDLYHAAARAGKALEGPLRGLYTELEGVLLKPEDSPIDFSRPKRKRVSHSGVMNLLFLGGSAVLLTVGASLKWHMGHLSWFRWWW